MLTMLISKPHKIKGVYGQSFQLQSYVYIMVFVLFGSLFNRIESGIMFSAG